MVRLLFANEAGRLARQKSDRLAEAEAVVAPILEDVRRRGDAAVLDAARRYDAFEGTSLILDPDVVAAATDQVGREFLDAVDTAAKNIAAFARLQMPREFQVELAPGHRVGQVVRPLDRIAAYVPGGRYPLPSTALMAAVTARVAGVGDVWVTTPNPCAETLAACHRAGVANVAAIGGAHAIAAFAFGTTTIPKVDRIVGPGNAFVTAAKKLLAGEVGIDFIAGPTEVVIVAETGNARWIAADMLSQAEHDTDASAVLLTTSRELACAVAQELTRQLEGLPTADVATQALQSNSAIVVTDSVAQAMDIANELCPEHLCLEDPRWLDEVRNAGSVFLGAWSTEPAGDYASGPNHVLPTSGVAKLRGGLSVADFVKVVTFQELSEDALRSIAPAVTVLARAEGLEAHARAVEVRVGA